MCITANHLNFFYELEFRSPNKIQKKTKHVQLWVSRAVKSAHILVKHSATLFVINLFMCIMYGVQL